MGFIAATPRNGTDACRLCRDAPSREECFLSIGGEERPICRACWEQALVDLRRVERRLRAAQTPWRYRLS